MAFIFQVTIRNFKMAPMKKSVWADLPKTSTRRSLQTGCESNRNPQAEFRGSQDTSARLLHSHWSRTAETVLSLVGVADVIKTLPKATFVFMA